MNINFMKKLLMILIVIYIFLYLNFKIVSKVNDKKNNKTSEILKIDKINNQRKNLESIDEDTYNVMNKYILNGFEYEDYSVNFTNEEDMKILGPYFNESSMLKYSDEIDINDKNTGVRYLRECVKRPDSYYFTIKRKADKSPIGQINIKFYQKEEMTISYWIGKKFRKNGIMSKIGTRFVEDVFFNLKNINVLIIYLLKTNVASMRYAEKLHKYIKSRHKCKTYVNENEPKHKDTIFYFLIKDDN